MKKTLKAWLKKNQLTPDPNDFSASVVSLGSVDVTTIIDELVNEGMEVKRETAVDIVTRFNRKAADLALSGYNVNTGLVYMRSIVKGTFYNKTWNPDVNSVYVSITQGFDLRQAVADTAVEILGEQADRGITFTNTTTKVATKLDADHIVLNEPSRLLILVPTTLEAGEYELSVSTQFSNGKTTLKTPRTATAGFAVIVA